MNWYRFKIELFAWVSTTALAVLTTITAIAVLYPPQGPGWMRSYPVSMRLVAEHEYIVPYALVVLVILLWLCRWKALRIVRSDRRYGTR